MKKIIISYSLIIGLMLSCITPSVQATKQTTNCENSIKRGPSRIAKISNEFWEGSKIIIEAIAAAIAYGIVNDQVTVRVCPEYFTEGFHKWMLQSHASCGDKLAARMLTIQDPTVLGLYWGVKATWLFGALLGVPTAITARVGKLPKLGIKDLIKPLGVGIAVLYAMALAAGSYGYVASKNGWLSDEMKERLRNAAGNTPEAAMHRYTANTFVHHVGYFGGGFVALGLISWTIHERYGRARDFLYYS